MCHSNVLTVDPATLATGALLVRYTGCIGSGMRNVRVGPGFEKKGFEKRKNEETMKAIQNT